MDTSATGDMYFIFWIFGIFGYFIFGGCLGMLILKFGPRARNRDELADEFFFMAACMIGWPLVLPAMAAAFVISTIVRAIVKAAACVVRRMKRA